MKRKIKRNTNKFINRTTWFFGRKESPFPQRINYTPLDLKAGDIVRIRSREEIEATLDVWGELKGCRFMSLMRPYCGTTQRILKPVRRFIDERDYQYKKTQGIYLLEGLMCQGSTSNDGCDRSCFFFWREEWLEKIEKLNDNRL